MAVAGCRSGGGGEPSPPPVFGPPILTELGDAPRAVAYADFNGDGRTDAVVRLVHIENGVATASRGVVLLGNGDGTFQPGVVIAGLDGVVWMAVGDLNGDGKPDIVATGCTTFSCSPADASLFVLLGNGDGTFEAPVAYPADSSAGALCIGDFNADGLADVAVNHDNNFVSLLTGIGDGSLRPATPGSEYFGFAPGLACVDINGDGNQDVVVFAGGTFNGWVTVLPGNGDATFGPRLGNATPVYPDQWAIVDFNHDGKSDLVYNGNRFRGPGAISLQLGNGDGTFGAASNPAYPTAYFTATFAAGDIDRDGNPDLVVRSTDTSSLSILYGNGDGTFMPAEDFPVALDAGNIDRLIDLDGDGRLDLVLTTPTGLAVLRGMR